MAEISARKRIWGWMMFDVATQPFYTVLLTFFFAPYFAVVAFEHFLGTGLEETVAEAQAQQTWGTMVTLAGIAIAVTAPVMGALADTRGRRIPWIAAFSVVYIVGTYALWWMVPDGSAITQTLWAFAIAMIAAEIMLVFINAILPSLGTTDEVGELSGNGFALGYCGGVAALFITLFFFVEQGSGKTFLGLSPAFGLDPEAREGTRSVGPFTTIWFIVFMIPFFLWVRDPIKQNPQGGMGTALRNLGGSLAAVPKQSSLFAYLASSMFYRDALAAIYSFGGTYAALVLDWQITTVGIFGIISAISAAVFTWAGGQADRRFGPKPVIVVTVWILILVCAVIVGMSREAVFGVPLPEGSGLPDLIMFGLGAIIGGAGGALQGASRTMMARHADPERPTEAFGLYAFSGKATSFLGPAMITVFTGITESVRLGFAPVVGLFILALVLLRWVDPMGNRGAAWSASS